MKIRLLLLVLVPVFVTTAEEPTLVSLESEILKMKLVNAILKGSSKWNDATIVTNHTKRSQPLFQKCSPIPDETANYSAQVDQVVIAIGLVRFDQLWIGHVTPFGGEFSSKKYTYTHSSKEGCLKMISEDWEFTSPITRWPDW